MCGKRSMKLFGALVIVSMLLTSVGSSHGVTAATHIAALPAVASASRAVAIPAAAHPIDPSPYGQYSPKLAGDSAGNLFAVWQDYREASGRPHIRFAYRPAGGAWQPSLKLDPADAAQWEPSLAVDGGGNAYAAWSDRRSGYDQVYFASRPAGGAWGAGQAISPTIASDPQGAPALAVNRRGEAVVFWAQGRCCVNPSSIYVATRLADGSWGVAQRIGQARPWGSYLSAALDDWGQAYAIWLDPTGTQVSFATRPPAATWAAAQNIRDSATGTVMHLSLAVDSAGNAHAVWVDERNSDDDIFAAYRPAGGPWSANVRVNDDATNANQFLPHVAVDGAGNAVAFWGDPRRDLADIYAALRYRGSGWGPNQLLLNWSVLGAANRARPQVDSQSLAGLDDTFESFQPNGGFGGNGANCGQQMAVAAGATAGLAVAFTENVEYVFEASPSAGADYSNVYYVAPGGTMSAAGLGPAVAGEGNPCHAGNGSEEPVHNPDDSTIAVEIAGFTFYVPADYYGEPANNGNGDTVAVEIAGVTIYAPADYYNAVVTEATGEDWWKYVDDATYQAHTQHAEDLAGRIEAVGLGYIPEYILQDMTPAELAWTEELVASIEYQQLQEQIEAAETAQWTQQEAEFQAQLEEEANYLAWLAQQPTSTAPQSQAAQPQMVPSSVLQQMVQQMTPLNVAAIGAQAVPATTGQPTQPQPTQPTQQQQPQTSTGKPTSLTNYYQAQYGQTTGFWAWIKSLFSGKKTTDPVLPHSGEFVYQDTLLRIPGRGLDYAFRLTYHSQLVYDGPTGWGWEHNYDRRVMDAGGGSLGLWDGAGRIGLFSFDGTTFTPSAGRYTAVVTSTAGITLTNATGQVESYYPLGGSAAAGRLRSVSDRNGNTLRFAYDVQGRLQTVTDTLGRIITYSYDANNRITAVTDFAGRAVRLAYDANGDLVSITTPAVTGTPNGNDFPAGKTTRFAYTAGFSDQRLNHNLTIVIAPNEVADGSLTPRTVNTYGTSGLTFDRVVNQSWGGGRSNASGIPAGGTVTFAYTTTIAADAPVGAYSKTTITDRGGNVRELWHDGAGHRLRSRQVVGSQVVVYDYNYNTDGQITGITYPSGNRIEASYDEAATSRLAQGNLLTLRRLPDTTRGCNGAGSTPCPDLITIYTYEPAFQRVKTITNPRGSTTTYTYDARGNLTQVAFPNVTVGPAAPQAASLDWTYNAWGQPLTFTNAEGHTTRHEYYTSGPATGYRQRVVRDSGSLNVTTEYAYDTVGNVISVTDGRGIRTDYAVNALNQMVKVTRAAAVPLHVSRFTPDEKVTREDVQPESVTLDYETLYYYDTNDNVTRVDVENVLPEMDTNFHPTGNYSRDAANPWLTTSFTYDLLDNLVRRTAEVSPSLQAVTEYRYNALERLVSLTLPAGNRTEYTYDGRSRLQQMTQGAGTADATTTIYAYDVNGNQIRVTDGVGHPTDAVYDGFDRLVGLVDALGNVTVWGRDANGNVVEKLIRDGQNGRNPGRTLTAAGLVTLSHTRYSFDEQNRRFLDEQKFFTANVGTGVATPITADGDGDGWVETAYNFDRNGNIVAKTDDNGHITAYAYDGMDRLALRTDALNNTVACIYDGDNNLVQTVATERQPDSLTPTEIFTATRTYDAANRLAQATDALGQTTRYAYDSRGNLVFRSDANGPLMAATNDEGRTTDGFRLSSFVVGQPNDHGNTVIFSYDGLSHLLTETHHLRAGGVGVGAVIGQATMAYAYDLNGNRVGQIDPNGNATAYGYDVLGRLTGITRADGSTTTYAYDRASNLARLTDANGSTVTNSYDAANRRVRTDVTRGAGVGGTTLQTFAWDGFSRLITATDNNDPATSADDSNLAFTYDSLSNRRSETQDGRAVNSTYDGLGNRLTLTYPGGTSLTYTYDALNRVKRISDVGGTVAGYDYLGPWRVWRRTNSNGTFAAYTFDGARRLTGLAYRLTSNQLLITGFQYTYDRVGNRLTETAQPDNHQMTYTYDSLNRLTRAQATGSDLQYSYDLAGNRVAAVRNGQVTSYTANSLNQYLLVGGETRSYDRNGNLLRVRMVTLPVARGLYLPLVLKSPSVVGRAALVEGNPTHEPLAGSNAITETIISYRYDFANRLLGLTETTTATAEAKAQTTTLALVFTYDTLGRQVSAQTQTDMRRFIYTGRQVAEERNGAGSLLATYIGMLAMERGGSRVFYQTDGPSTGSGLTLGSVRALADGTGTVVERVEYDPFGAPAFSSGGTESVLGNPFLFYGRWYATGGSFYVFGSRRYEPSTGRYMQPGREVFGNSYIFAGNNPGSYTGQ